eukprot:scaffold2004_cov107-Isochrysis_galbana.AAC.7
MSILACVAWAKTAARVPLEPLMLYEATSSGPSPGKPSKGGVKDAGVSDSACFRGVCGGGRGIVRRVLWWGGAFGVLVEALFAVGAEALDGRVGLEVALDRAHALAVGVVLPRAGEVVERRALLAPSWLRLRAREDLSSTVSFDKESSVGSRQPRQDDPCMGLGRRTQKAVRATVVLGGAEVDWGCSGCVGGTGRSGKDECRRAARCSALRRTGYWEAIAWPSPCNNLCGGGVSKLRQTEQGFSLLLSPDDR